ncbi:unnamed protein product, partial [Closterium sp. NIES-54]
MTPKLIGYVDADHAGDSDNKRSRTGYVYRLKPIGLISWQSNKQELIALSSAEAEYITLCSATKEGLYLPDMLEEAKLAQLPSFFLFYDNQSAIRIASKNGFANRTKHIALQYFFVKDEIEKGRLELSYCPTSEMAADYLTKKLGKQKLDQAAPPSRAAPPTEPCHTTEPHCPACPTASSAPAATAPTAPMASPTVLTFDAEGRAVDFDVLVDDLQLFLQCDSRDGVSLFDHMSSVSTAPATTADSTVRSQWTTRDVVARLDVRSHLPPAERAHFGQYKTARSLYDAVVARYSSPDTAALSCLMLPYLFPDLGAFATVADLVAHLRTSDARYHAALPTQFCAKNPPPMYITLYYLVTRLLDSLSSVLLAATIAPASLKSVPLSPFSPLLLLQLLSTSLALRRLELRLPLVGDAATARARGARVVEGTAGAAAEAMEEVEGVAVEVGVVLGVGASVAAVEVVEAAAEVVEAAAAVVEVAAVVVLVEVQPRSVEDLVVASASSSRVPVRPHRPSSFVSGMLGVGGLG